MKKIIFFAFFAISFGTVNSQVIYEEFNSKKLDETRKLKIQLPRNYETKTDKKYPIVLVLDADYLFEPVAGNIDYFSYWEDMPEAIVVGVMQSGSRYKDGEYDDRSYMPIDKGASFFEFIGLELIPYIDENYRTAKFIIGVGHDFTANFLNYYLFKDPPLLNGYINLSPDLAPMMEERLVQRIPQIPEKLFYYLATGTDDIKGLKESTESLNNQLKGIESETFNYYYDNFENATHYTLVGRGIPNALEKIFSVYRPISKAEFSEVLMNKDTQVYQYLIDKYQIIKDLFGLDIPIRINDFIVVGTAAEKQNQWEAVENLAKLAKKQYPDNVLGDYYLGRFYESKGDYRKAIRIYRSGFGKQDADFITQELLLDLADDLSTRD